MFVRSLCLIALLVSFVRGQPPELQLAKTYAVVTADGELNMAEYWVSEKLDGVRAYWDGSCLRSRGGTVFQAPKWFIEGLPKEMVLDGELWIARGKFELVSGIVRQQMASDEAWRQVSYCVFDLPAHGGAFDARVVAMRQLVAAQGTGWLCAVEQLRVLDVDELQQLLEKVVNAGGEGLMLHRGSAYYQACRTDDLVKMKPLDDAEAVVVAHSAGEGKYAGMLGALTVELPDGKRFNVGTGFSDAERRSPPPIGSTITFQHNGLTRNGLPRFARFLRVREVE